MAITLIPTPTPTLTLTPSHPYPAQTKKAQLLSAVMKQLGAEDERFVIFKLALKKCHSVEEVTPNPRPLTLTTTLTPTLTLA